MKRAALLVVKLLFLALLMGVFFWSNDPFLMVGGSESTSFLVMPSMPVQVGAFLVCAAALLIPARNGRRIALFAVAIVAALVGGHRLLVDNLHNRISDIYLAVPVQILPLDPANEARLSVQRVFGGITIGPAGSNKPLRIISPPVIGLDKNQLTALIPSQN
jgi:hypothetical protein